MPDVTRSRSKSRSPDKHQKHRKRKHGSVDPEDPAPASHKKHKKSHHHHSRDRDKNKDAKKRKKEKKKEKKTGHHRDREERKKDLLLKQTEVVKGQGHCEDKDKINQDGWVTTTARRAPITDHLSEKPAGVEKNLEHQQRPAYCQQVTASVIGQIRVSEQTRRRIADGGSSSIDVDDAKSSCCNNDVIIGSFGRLSPPVCGKKVPETASAADTNRMSCQEDKRKRRRSPSPRQRRSSASCRGGDGGRRRGDRSSSKEERRKGRADEDEGRGSSRRSRRERGRRRSGSRSGSRRSSRSVDSDASDLSVKRGGEDGRLKIDRQRLRRRALENTVLRLDERCPRKLADMPCFKALGVRVSELEEICRRLAPSRQFLDKVDASSTAASITEHHHGGNKDCDDKKQQQQQHPAASLDPASSVCISSTAVRHPFQLRAETSTGSGALSSRFGGSLLTATGEKAVVGNKPLDKKELLSAFPVSSGEYHRNQDNTTALTAPTQLGLPSVSSTVKASIESDQWPAVAVNTTGLSATRVASSSAGIQMSLLVQPNQQTLQPRVPVVSASSSNGPLSHVVAQAAASAVAQQQRVLQLGDWATAKLLAAKSAPQTLLQQQQQQQQRSKSPQAWVTKHQFECARPITGGIGRQLMEKMGWRHGQGLGKRNEGPTEPLAIDFKTDRKGLASQEDKKQQQQQQMQQNKKKKNKPGAIAAVAAAAAASTMQVQHGGQQQQQQQQQCQLVQQSGKHPVSILMELTKQRRWPDPLFRQVEESGPPHDRCFVFCVRVFGTEYQPDRPSKNKKDAKASAATLALQKLGMLD